jgi:peptidoglycan-associated lipoprotein
MRTLAALLFIPLVGCAHHQAQTRAEAQPPAPAPTQPTASAAVDTRPSCNRDLDCASGQLCLEGRCQDIASHLGACTSVRVHFELNASDIGAADRDGLERAARCLKADHSFHIAIQGNADERGTEEYNLALGEHRAHAVADYLRSLGAAEAQLQTVSFGKEQPLCSQHDEACWAQNRRADLVAQNSGTRSRRPSHRK